MTYRYQDGVAWAIAWLNDRAKKMNDPKAHYLLHSAAFHMRQDFEAKEAKDAKATLMSEQFRQYQRRRQTEGS
jgi:hypothetical protein